MNPKIILCLALVLSGVLSGCSTTHHSTAVEQIDNIIVTPQPAAPDEDLTRQISTILTEWQKIKPGMTRAELLKVFTTEGGLSTATHRTFVHGGCRYIKVDVDFTLSDPKQSVIEERPTDIISKISKPYLEWSSQ